MALWKFWKFSSLDNIPSGNLRCWLKWQIVYIAAWDSVVTTPLAYYRFYTYHLKQPSKICYAEKSRKLRCSNFTVFSRARQLCPRKPQALGKCVKKTAVIIQCSIPLILLPLLHLYLRGANTELVIWMVYTVPSK